MSREETIGQILTAARRHTLAYGEQALPSGATGTRSWEARQARLRRDEASESGRLTRADLLRVCFHRVLCEENATKRRAELVSLAACCVAWIEDDS